MRRGLVLLTAIAVLAAPSTAETVEGILPLTGCESLAFMITPAGSAAVAVDHREGAEAAQVTSWDLAEEQTYRFEIPAQKTINADPAELAEEWGWLLPVDEASFAYWNPDAAEQRSYLMLSIDDGRALGAAPWLGPPADRLPGGASWNGSVLVAETFDRRGAWIGRGWAELACAGGQPAADCSPGSLTVSSLNIRTGARREATLDAPTSSWRLDRDGGLGLRIVPDGASQELQVRDGDEWRAVLRFESFETLELLPPDDFDSETPSILVASDIGRSGKAVGRLDLATGTIAYANPESSRGVFVGAELSHDASALLWETRRGRSATGAGPVTVDVALAGAELPQPGDSARGFSMTFGSADSEALYDSVRSGWGHVDVLGWSDDGGAAIIALWGPDARRRIEAVRIVDERAVSERRALCDTALD